jgi:hypothetical protein
LIRERRRRKKSGRKWKIGGEKEEREREKVNKNIYPKPKNERRICRPQKKKGGKLFCFLFIFVCININFVVICDKYNRGRKRDRRR